MRLDSFSIVLVLAASLIISGCIFPSHALAAEDNEAPSCGRTADEAIAAAETALHSQASDTQARALRCVLQAVKQIRADQPIITNGETRVLRFPAYTPPKESKR